MFMIRQRPHMAVFLLVVVALSSCGGHPQPTATPKKTDAEVRQEEAKAAERRKAFEAERAQLDSELAKATPEQVRHLVSSCKSSVLSAAKADNRSPFEVFVVDEYSADSYQAAAYIGGGKVLGDEERVKSFLKARKGRTKDLDRELELSYTAIFTEDSFSGPQKRPQSYSCRVKTGLAVEASRSY